MFYVLAIAICLAVLFLVLAGSSILLVPAILYARRMARTAAPENAANMLLAARLLPLLASSVITLGLALPAFLEFEPHSTGEGIGLRLDVLAAAGALILACMMARAWRIVRATAQMRRSWREKSARIYVPDIDPPVYRVKSASSLMAVTGIFRTEIFISDEVTETLSPEELKAALEHEVAHVASFDNLKQTLLKITQPPHWFEFHRDIDREWSGVSEIAADCNALARGVSVLDLSSALIKVGRLNRIPAPNRAVASHLVPPACSSSLEQRVVRLSELLESSEQTPVKSTQSGKLMVASLAGIATYIVCVYAFLPAVHEALEFLVR